MSKPKHHKTEASPTNSPQPTANSCSSDAPIYQLPNMSQQPIANSPVSNSQEPTANSQFSNSPQPTANSCSPNSQQPTANSQDQSVTPRPVQASFTGRYGEEDEINLLDYLRVIYKHKWMIMLFTILTMASAVALSLSNPRMYQARTSIVPPIDTISETGGLAARLGGSSLLQGMLRTGNLSDLYVGILESRVVSDALIDRFNLRVGIEEVRTKADARLTLKNKTTIKALRDGTVLITVKDRDPNQAAALCNAYVEELDRQNRRLSGGNATSKRIFLETRLNEIQGELSKIESLQSREVQIKEMLFELLNRECEIAKIEEAKSMPTIQVLDEAIVPEEGMARGTIRKGQLAGVVAFIFGIFVAFVREYMQGLKKVESLG